MKTKLTLLFALAIIALTAVSCQPEGLGGGIVGKWYDTSTQGLNPDMLFEIDEEGIWRQYLPRIVYEGETVVYKYFNSPEKFLVTKFEDGVLHVRNHKTAGKNNDFGIPAGTTFYFDVTWEENSAFYFRVDKKTLSVYEDDYYWGTMERVDADTYTIGNRCLCRIKSIVYE